MLVTRQCQILPYSKDGSVAMLSDYNMRSLLLYIVHTRHRQPRTAFNHIACPYPAYAHARLCCLQAEMVGLAVVIVDALTRREWVQEDYVPQAIDGAPDLRVSMGNMWSECAEHTGTAGCACASSV